MARMPDFEMPEPLDDARRSASLEIAPLATPRPSPVGSPDPAGSASEPSTPARAIGLLRDRWRRARVPVVAFALGIVVAIAATTAAGVVRDRGARDEVVALLDAYLAAVESPDRGAATALTPALDERVASSALLRRAPAVVEPPTVVCDEPRIGGDLATVACRVRVEGRVDAATVALERLGAGWELTRGLEVPVRIQSGTLLVERIAGTPLDEASARGQRALWLLPGRYAVEARVPAQLEIDRLDGLVVSTAGGSVRWTGDTTDAVEADVAAAALAFVEGCVADPVEGCPALQPRDPADPFEAFAVVGRLRVDDRYAMTYEVSLRRPIDEPREYLVVTVRVDFGEDLDRYDIAIL